MKQISLILFLLNLIGVATGYGQDSTSTIKCLFVGDVMQHGGQIEGAYHAKNDAYDYRDCFQFVKPIVQQADIAIANLEVTHAGKPYKGYPQFSAPPELSEALVDAGFNVIINANNHSCDGGANGVVKTLDVLDRLGVLHTGTFRNLAERNANYPLLVVRNNFRIAVLNYTYGTNGLSVPAPLIINYMDSVQMKADFEKAKSMQVNVIICMLHWGAEYQNLPNDSQKKWEQFCYQQGADMVIGSHPHVIQPVEVKTVGGEKKLTVWSLGNFVSNQRDRYKNGGLIVEVNLEKKNGNAEIRDVYHRFAYVFPRQEKVVKPYYILPYFDYNDFRADFMSSEIMQQYTTFFEDSRALFEAHSIGTNELFLSDTAITAHYSKLLKGYYSVQLTTDQVTEMANYPLNANGALHKLLGADGDYHWVLGYFDSEAELRIALANSTLRDVRTIVFISPTIYKKLP
jgi:hypothetical protein